MLTTVVDQHGPHCAFQQTFVVGRVWQVWPASAPELVKAGERQGEHTSAKGVLRGTSAGVDESGPAVAQRVVAELVELGFIGDAGSQNGLSGVLPFRGVQGESSELPSTGQTRSSVAPGRSLRAGLVKGFAFPFPSGDGPWPPGAMGKVTKPTIQYPVDVSDGFCLAGTVMPWSIVWASSASGPLMP